jgi:predicted ester cyclase
MDEEVRSMSVEDNKAFIRRYLGAISGKPKTSEAIDRYVADEELKKHIVQAEMAFPSYSLDIDEIIGEGDLVSVRGTVRGVHKGSLQGIAPTGKEVTFGLFITYRVAGGKIVDHWMLVDNLSVMQQLGAIPAAVH